MLRAVNHRSNVFRALCQVRKAKIRALPPDIRRRIGLQNSNILDAYDCVHVPISDRRGRILDAQALSVRSVTVQFPCGHTSSSGNTFESNQCIDTASALPSACQALVASQLTETCATELEDF